MPPMLPGRPVLPPPRPLAHTGAVQAQACAMFHRVYEMETDQDLSPIDDRAVGGMRCGLAIANDYGRRIYLPPPFPSLISGIE